MNKFTDQDAATASAQSERSELARQVIEDTNATLAEQSATMRSQQQRIIELEAQLADSVQPAPTWREIMAGHQNIEMIVPSTSVRSLGVWYDSYQSPTLSIASGPGGFTPEQMERIRKDEGRPGSVSAKDWPAFYAHQRERTAVDGVESYSCSSTSKDITLTFRDWDSNFSFVDWLITVLAARDLSAKNEPSSDRINPDPRGQSYMGEKKDGGRDAALVEIAAQLESGAGGSQRDMRCLLVDTARRLAALAAQAAPEVAITQPVAPQGLLNCPHCGTAPELVDNGTGSYRVACFVSKGGCGATTRMTFDKGLTAKAEWNRRVAPEVASVPDAGEAPFMYAIMAPNGAAYYEEYCVDSTPEALYSEVNALNDSPDTGYQVVPLYTRPRPAPAVLLERAAQVCDQQADGTNGPYRSACLQCANAVRALRGTAVNAGAEAPPATSRETPP